MFLYNFIFAMITSTVTDTFNREIINSVTKASIQKTRPQGRRVCLGDSSKLSGLNMAFVAKQLSHQYHLNDTMLTCPCDLDTRKTHFYAVKLGGLHGYSFS